MKSDFLQLIEQLAGAMLIITVLADVFLRSFTRGSAPGLSATVSRAGPTPTDFVTALYVGGSSVSIITTSDIAPKTAGFRLFFLINSLIGTNYRLPDGDLPVAGLYGVATAEYSRPEASGPESTNGRRCRIGRRPRTAGAIRERLHDYEIASEMTGVKESHHFYPVLFYFRFREPFYSVSRSARLALDTVR